MAQASRTTATAPPTGQPKQGKRQMVHLLNLQANASQTIKTMAKASVHHPGASTMAALLLDSFSWFRRDSISLTSEETDAPFDWVRNTP